METERPADEEFERGLPIAAILDEYLACAGRKPITAWVGSSHEEREPRGAFHASGGGCLRRDILRWDGVKGDPVPGISLRRFAVGNLVESVVAEALRWKGVLIGEQVRVWRDWQMRAGRGHHENWQGRGPDRGPSLDLSGCLVSGTLDCFVRWDPAWASIVGPIPPDVSWRGRRFVLDVKSCHERKLDYLEKEPVDESYALQLAFYAWTYLEQYGRVWTHGREDEARLVYLGKDTMRVKQVGVSLEEWIPRARASLLAKRAAAEARIESGALPDELPVSDEGKRPWMCDPRYCEYAVAKANGQPVCPGVYEYWQRMAATSAEERKENGVKASSIRRTLKASAKEN